MDLSPRERERERDQVNLTTNDIKINKYTSNTAQIKHSRRVSASCPIVAGWEKLAFGDRAC